MKITVLSHNFWTIHRRDFEFIACCSLTKVISKLGQSAQVHLLFVFKPMYCLWANDGVCPVIGPHSLANICTQSNHLTNHATHKSYYLITNNTQQMKYTHTNTHLVYLLTKPRWKHVDFVYAIICNPHFFPSGWLCCTVNYIHRHLLYHA